MTTKTATVRAPSARRTSLAGLAVRTEHCPHVAGRLSGRGLDLPAADPTVAPTDRVVAVIAAAPAVADTVLAGFAGQGSGFVIEAGVLHVVAVVAAIGIPQAVR